MGRMGRLTLRFGMIFPKEPSGKTNLAAWGRKVVQALRALEVRPSPNYRVKQTSSGTILEFTAGASSAGAEIELVDCVTGTTYLVQGREKP